MTTQLLFIHIFYLFYSEITSRNPFEIFWGSKWKTAKVR